jgi:hypothetical protein
VILGHGLRNRSHVSRSRLDLVRNTWCNLGYRLPFNPSVLPEENSAATAHCNVNQSVKNPNVL